MRELAALQLVRGAAVRRMLIEGLNGDMWARLLACKESVRWVLPTKRPLMAASARRTGRSIMPKRRHALQLLRSACLRWTAQCVVFAIARWLKVMMCLQRLRWPPLKPIGALSRWRSSVAPGKGVRHPAVHDQSPLLDSTYGVCALCGGGGGREDGGPPPS